MAADWIKMRMGLRTHPKIVRMASALDADRFRVIGALHAVWCLADEHTEDGSLPGYTLNALDDSIGWPGFSQAMKDIDWLIVGAQGLVLPRFEEHNGQSAKRRATEAERKRNARKKSAPDADKKRTRERGRERSRSPVVPLNLPAGVTATDWQAFRDHRSENRKKLTPRAEELALGKLHHLAAQGYDPKKLLDLAIESGWATFYSREECKAAPAAKGDLGKCDCGAAAAVLVSGRPRCAKHVRGFEAAA